MRTDLLKFIDRIEQLSTSHLASQLLLAHSWMQSDYATIYDQGRKAVEAIEREFVRRDRLLGLVT